MKNRSVPNFPAICLTCSAALLAAGCSTVGAPRSETHATIWSDIAEAPLSVHGEMTFVSAVDGVATPPPRGYVLVPAGTHVLTLVHEKCWLPMLQKRCTASAETSDIVAELEAGIAYRLNGLTSPPRRVDAIKD